MTPIAGGPVLTAAGMRAAEERAISAGTSVEILMDRAGRGVATAVRRLASGYSVLVLCGPGNNGGDGYVAAAALAEAGLDVRVAATGEPTASAADADDSTSDDDDGGSGKTLLLIIVAGLAIGTVAGLVVRARRKQ